MNKEVKAMGKFERKARQQEYRTALGILNVIKEHANNNDMGKIQAFIEVWEITYTRWLKELEAK